MADLLGENDLTALDGIKTKVLAVDGLHDTTEDIKKLRCEVLNLIDLIAALQDPSPNE